MGFVEKRFEPDIYTYIVTDLTARLEKDVNS